LLVLILLVWGRRALLEYERGAKGFEKVLFYFSFSFFLSQSQVFESAVFNLILN